MAIARHSYRSYLNFGELKNPLNDGDLVATSLRKAGFEVRRKSNLSDSQMRAALREFSRESKNFDVSLVYYAGHGVQLSGKNYLLPVDLPLPESEQDIRLSAISVDDVLEVIASRYKIVILDACRDNPVLGRSISRGRSGAFRQGLAATTPTAEESGGIFIAYSTQADAIASDGQGQFSPFAEAFSRHASFEGSLDDMFSLVTKDVIASTRGVQRPFKYASLDSRLCLSSNCSAGMTAIEVERSASTNDSKDAEVDPAARRQRVTALVASFQKLKNKDAAGEWKRELNTLTARLWTATLPEIVPYFAPVQAGSGTVWGFKPRSLTVDAGRMVVDVVSAPLTQTPWKFSDSTQKARIDCSDASITFMSIELRGAVSKPIGNPVKMTKGAVGSGLIVNLCTLPVRLTPLWAKNEIDWTFLASVPSSDNTFVTANYLAQDIWFQEEANPAIRWVLVKRVPDKGVTRFDIKDAILWLGIDCKRNKLTETGGFYFDSKDEFLTFDGSYVTWFDIDKKGVYQPVRDALCSQ